MEAKYETRKQELLEECELAPEVFHRVLPRLERFMNPFGVPRFSVPGVMRVGVG